MMDTDMNLQKDAMEEKRTLLLFYYSSHGMSDNNLHLKREEAKVYPIEKIC